MLRSVRDINVKGKVVLCRVDYNVPIENGQIKHDNKITSSLSTIYYLLDNGAKIVITSHLGRPEGIDKRYSLEPVANHLAKLIRQPVEFSHQTVGEKAKAIINNMGKDTYQVVLLENTRFNEGETKNDENFSKNLADLADIFVSDAFGSVHRVHSSTVGVSQFLPSYAGMLVEEEYNRIIKVMENPKKPSLAIIGGAKVSTKLDILEKLINIVDTIIIGGGMAFTFLKSQGIETGKSLVENDMLDIAKELLILAKKEDTELFLPIDVKIAKSFDEPYLENNQVKIVDIDKIPSRNMALDIGPLTQDLFVSKIQKANNILWNGPMGVFENTFYQEGTKNIARAIVQRGVETIIGGGDTAFSLKLLLGEKIPDSVYISTGGGATLEFIGGSDLPGLNCLMAKSDFE